ncbi:hypothetical protein DL768_003647 [Monosporascus sp. mg162]|nr:hypothetical protein DL768_003647 [Monosporascus sp. mg162]
MSHRKVPGRGTMDVRPGHQYQSNYIGPGANAHFGDVNYFENPLSHLPYAEDAPFNSYSKQHEPTCLSGTRVDLLKELYDWADGQGERCIFWLSGLAGTGKSTIARTVADNYSKQGRVGASFFFSRGGGDVSHAGKFVTSIALQLAHNVPASHQHICDAITERSNIVSQSLRDQWHHLVLRPLSKQDCNGCQSSYILVVDALDECDDGNNTQIIPQLLAEARSLKMVQLRVFITSRLDNPIRRGFDKIPESEHQDFVLHEIDSSITEHDISLFLSARLREIRETHFLSDKWPDGAEEKLLVQKAGGLFIYIATACLFIENSIEPEDDLKSILKGDFGEDTPLSRLDKIYKQVIHTAFERTRSRHREKTALCSLIQEGPQDMSPRALRLLDQLRALLIIPKTPEEQTPIRSLHISFRDFLLDRDRCGDPNFWVDEREAHQKLADGCIRLMDTSLRQDILGINAPGVLVANVEGARVEQCLPPGVQYACLYWIQHLQKSGARLGDNDPVHQFLKDHFLHWLEALSWMRKVSEGIHAIATLDNCPDLSTFIHDMKRFALYGRSAVEQAPLQTLESHSGSVNAVAFSPDGKIMASGDGDGIGIGTVKLWDAATGALQQTFKCHSDSGPVKVNAVAFSPDGEMVASGDGSIGGGGDGTIKLWDAATGALQQTLKYYSNSVNAVAFSPDGKMVASGNGSIDGRGTVNLWNAATGAVQTLKCHLGSGLVNAVAFSPDGKMVASGNGGKFGCGTVRLWDAATGALQQTFRCYPGSVNAVAFSPDGKIVASGSRKIGGSGTVTLWDTATGALQQTLRCYSDSVNAVSFSPDGRMVASGDGGNFGGGTVKLWDAVTGGLQQTFRPYSGSVNAVAFSPDGKMVASGNSGTSGTVKLWDTATEALQQMLKGQSHSGPVNAVTFSPDGKMVASGGCGMRRIRHGGKIILWDAATGALQQTLKYRSNSVNAVSFSPDGKMVASGDGSNFGVGTIKLWDVTTGALPQTLKCHSNSVNAVAFSPDGKMLASGDGDNSGFGTIRLWDAATGALRQTLQADMYSPSAVRTDI